MGCLDVVVEDDDDVYRCLSVVVEGDDDVYRVLSVVVEGDDDVYRCLSVVVGGDDDIIHSKNNKKPATKAGFHNIFYKSASAFVMLGTTCFLRETTPSRIAVF